MASDDTKFIQSFKNKGQAFQNFEGEVRVPNCSQSKVSHRL
jgi:hypothetical protein